MPSRPAPVRRAPRSGRCPRRYGVLRRGHRLRRLSTRRRGQDGHGGWRARRAAIKKVMRQSRTASGAASLLLAAAAALAGPAAGEAAPSTTATAYVALGDSYAAGVGAGGYLASGTDCLRSSRAYPALWAAAHAPSSFDFTACNHARTGDVLAGQLGPLSPRTGLVTLTVGGSDAGFVRVMATCALPGRDACLSAVAAANSFMDATLP